MVHPIKIVISPPKPGKVAESTLFSSLIQTFNQGFFLTCLPLFKILLPSYSWVHTYLAHSVMEEMGPEEMPKGLPF